MRQREKLRQTAWEQVGACSGDPHSPLNESRRLYWKARAMRRAAEMEGDRKAFSDALNACKELKPVLQRMADRTRTALAVRQARREWDEHFVRGAA